MSFNVGNISNTSSDSDLFFYPDECPFCSNIIDPYIIPAVCILGILGNILAVVVVLLTKLRRHPPSTYLIALALSDTIFLFDQILMLHHACNLTGMCQLCIFVQYFAPFCSSWLLVGFTFERFIVVVYPIRQLQWGSWRATRVFIAVLLLIGGVLSAPYLYIAVTVSDADGDYQRCSYRTNSTLVEDMVDSLFYTEATVSFFVPFTAITVLNVFIVRAVRKSVHMQAGRESAALRSHRSSTSSSITGANGVLVSSAATAKSSIAKSQRTKREQTSAAITRMLILVSATFIVTNFPMYIVRIYSVFDPMSRSRLALQVTEYPYQLNFTLNFLLYSFSSATFRGALCKLCCRCWGSAVPQQLRSTDGHLPSTSQNPSRSTGTYVELYRMNRGRQFGTQYRGDRGETSRFLSPT